MFPNFPVIIIKVHCGSKYMLTHKQSFEMILFNVQFVLQKNTHRCVELHASSKEFYKMSEFTILSLILALSVSFTLPYDTLSYKLLR